MKKTGRKIMVVMLALTMTLSTFISFSFAEEPQNGAGPDGTAAAAEEKKTAAAEKEATPAPAPGTKAEPVKKENTEPAPTSEPEPAKKENTAPAPASGTKAEPVKEEREDPKQEEVKAGGSEVKSGVPAGGATVQNGNNAEKGGSQGGRTGQQDGSITAGGELKADKITAGGEPKEQEPEPGRDLKTGKTSVNGGNGGTENEEAADEDTAMKTEETAEEGQPEKKDEKGTGEDGEDKENKDTGDKNKEDKDKEDKDKEEKEKMPAQSFSGSAGGLSVRASAGKGVFPEGTKMSVSPISAGYVMSAAEALIGENGMVVDAKAVDITFTKDGSEIQPAAGSVKVSLSANGSVDGEEHEAVHISGGSASSMGDASASFASFRADHFSIYGIIGVDYEDKNVQKQERHTYQFYVDGNLVDTQTVTDEDTLTEPQAPPSTPGRVFRGWQVTREDDTNIYPPYTPPFGTVDIPVGDHAWADKVFRVDAVFDATYYVTFYKDEKKTSVLRTKAAGKDTKITTNDVSFDFGKGKAITGWKNGSDTVGSTITVTGDIELTPVISDVKWVKFESNGGTPVAPVYSVENSAVSEPTAPTRSGYRFAGWYKESELITPYKFKNPVTEDITLYARWNSADKVTYTVVYWKQNANDDGYTFVESETGSDYAGEAASYSGKDNRYEGFTLNRAKSDVDVIIKGNGTTIKNVYYDRKTYPLTFYRYKKGTIRSPAGWEKVDERTFKYQEDTSAFWHNVTQKYSQYQWFISENSNTFYSYAPPMQPADGDLSGFSGIKAYGRTANNSYTIRYLEEGTDREIKEAFTGRTSQTKIRFTKEDHIIIPGFTFSREGSFDGDRNGALYYSRNSYTLKLFPNGGPAPEGGSEFKGIRFEESLSKYLPSNYTVGKTTAEFEGITKTFAGWYDNEPLDGEAFSFNSTMPALEAVKQTDDKSTLALYAKWVTDEHTVTFDLNGGTINGAGAIEPEIVEAENTATQPAGEMKKDGFTFGGWETADGRLFHFDTIITADTELTAIWHADKDEDIMIVYSSGDMSDSVFTDSRTYHRNAEAVVKGVPEVKEEYRKQGYYFKGWRVGNSDTMVSRGTFVVIDPDTMPTKNGTEKKLTLTAVYEQKKTHTAVTYNSNIPDGISQTFTDDAVINKEYSVKDFAGTGMTAADSALYEFTGWNTDPDGEGKMLKGRETVAAGKGGIVLYAQWRKKEITPETVDVKVRKEWNDEGNLDGIRPSEVTVLLLVRGDMVPDMMPVILSEENGWSHTWEDLPAYEEDGKELIEYSVMEEDVPDKYIYELTGSLAEGFTIVNTHIPEKIPGASDDPNPADPDDPTPVDPDKPEEPGNKEPEKPAAPPTPNESGGQAATEGPNAPQTQDTTAAPDAPPAADTVGRTSTLAADPAGAGEKRGVLGAYKDDRTDRDGDIRTSDKDKSSDGGTASSTAASKRVQTGDRNSVMLYAYVMFMAAALLLIMLFGRREKEKDQDHPER